MIPKLKRNSLYSVILIITLILNFACSEKYFPKINSSGGMLVVDGKITNTPGPYEVNLFRTVEIESNDSLINESNATVFIHCDDGNSVPLYESAPGKYQTIDQNFIGQIGKSYWVEINTSDGNNYESISEEIKSPFEITTIYGEQNEVIINIDETLNAVSLYFDLINEDNNSNYYLWNYNASWEWHTISKIPKSKDPAYICYPYESSNNVNIYDASILSKKNIKHLPLSTITEKHVNLLYEYYISVNAYSISEKCYVFWDNIKKVSEANGNLFDIIPANVQGNIECCNSDDEVLGYFQVSSYAQKGGTFNEKSYDVDFASITPECKTFEISPLTYNPKRHHIVSVNHLPEGGTILNVRYNFCYDCSLKYSPNKPSFWP